MGVIRAVQAKEILDSRGIPSIQVSLWTEDGIFVQSSIPNGNQLLPHEAQILLDNNLDYRKGKGVQKATALINQMLAPQLVGKDPEKQEDLDQLLIDLDGTEQKSQYGANTVAVVSQAIFKAGAASQGMSVYQSLFERYRLSEYLHIPTCIYGLVNGGNYGSGNLDLQEFLVLPASHIDYRVSLEIENTLRDQLFLLFKQRKANYATGILGGFTPSLQKNTDVFDFIIEAARKTDYILSRDFFFGIDAGAEHLLDRGRYTLRDRTTVYSENEMVEYYKNLKDQYNITYFEDPFTFQNTDLWKVFTADLGETTKVVMDSYTVTNAQRIQEAIQNKYANGVIIKPSQIGTVTEAIRAVKTARAAGWDVIVSQRSGETNDDFLADFAVGIGADFVKFGPTNRGEAVSKYNRLADIYLEIEQKITQEHSSSELPPQQEFTQESPVTLPPEPESTEPLLAQAEPTPLPPAPTEPLASVSEEIQTSGETPAEIPNDLTQEEENTLSDNSALSSSLPPELASNPVGNEKNDSSLLTEIPAAGQTASFSPSSAPEPVTEPPSLDPPDVAEVQKELNQVAQAVVSSEALPVSAAESPSSIASPTNLETLPVPLAVSPLDLGTNPSSPVPLPSEKTVSFEPSPDTPPENQKEETPSTLEPPAPEATEAQSAINSTLQEMGSLSVPQNSPKTSA